MRQNVTKFSCGNWRSDGIPVWFVIGTVLWILTFILSAFWTILRYLTSDILLLTDCKTLWYARMSNIPSLIDDSISFSVQSAPLCFRPPCGTATSLIYSSQFFCSCLRWPRAIQQGCKFSKIVHATPNISAPEGWHEASSILRTHKY